MDKHLEQVEAFKGLLGLQSLPTDGKQAAQAARQFSGALLSTIRPAPILSQLAAQLAHSRPALKPRFVDVSTGMRLRYLEWGSGEDVVLLLHGLAESADAWAPLAEQLRQRGYHVFALDLRGHGDSQWSSGGRYTLELMAEDVQAFILEKDLYTHPVAVAGCGLGGAVALALAQLTPHLVGAAVVGEFALPRALVSAWEAEQGAEGGCEGAAPEAPGMRQRTEAVRAPGGLKQQGQGQQGAGAGAGALRSSELLPWWSFFLAQGATFYTPEECAALLCHPLANVGPEALLPLTTAAAAAAEAAEASRRAGPSSGGTAGAALGQPGGEEGDAGEGEGQQHPGRAVQEVLEGLQRPLGGAVRSAFAALRLPDAGGGWGGGSCDGQLALRMDPHFFLSFDAGALLTRMADLRCHLLLLHGSRSPWVAAADAQRLAALARGARSARAAALPSAGHHLASDHEGELLAALVAFLEGPAISCFEVGGAPCATGGGSITATAGPKGAGAMARRPELLDLKPLPQFESLEAAKKALGPRSIPTPAAISAELEKLRLEAGGEASEEEDEGATGDGRRQTALAKDPPNYFGFVG